MARPDVPVKFNSFKFISSQPNRPAIGRHAQAASEHTYMPQIHSKKALNVEFKSLFSGLHRRHFFVAALHYFQHYSCAHGSH